MTQKSSGGIKRKPRRWSAVPPVTSGLWIATTVCGRYSSWTPTPWLGYVALEVPSEDPAVVLTELHRRGWLYLYDGRGLGLQHPSVLPPTLLGTQDDPYRSLVWKLKREKVIASAPLIPFHEFRWGAWLRSRQLPPFSSAKLEPALPAARALARSQGAAQLAGWIGPA